MKTLEVKVNMDGKGSTIDNAYIERLLRILKQDYVYLNPAQDDWDLEDVLVVVFKRYNFKNSHLSIGRNKQTEVYNVRLNEAE